MGQRARSVIHWISTYVLSSGIAGATFSVSLAIISSLQAPVISQAHPLSAFSSDPVMATFEILYLLYLVAVICILILVKAVLPTLLIAAVPEILGIKPRVMLWGVLGIAIALVTLALIEALDSYVVLEFQRRLKELLEAIWAFDRILVSFLISGGIAGMFFGGRRKKFESNRNLNHKKGALD